MGEVGPTWVISGGRPPIVGGPSDCDPFGLGLGNKELGGWRLNDGGGGHGRQPPGPDGGEVLLTLLFVLAAAATEAAAANP